MAEDFIRFEASFGRLDAAVEKFTAQLQEEAQILRAKGDKVRATQVESQIAALKGERVPVTEIDAATEALTREGQVLARNLELNLENLNAIRLQAEARRALTRMNLEAQRGPELIIPPQTRGGAFGELAGQQVERAARQAALNEALAREATLRRAAAAAEERELLLAHERLAQERLIASAQVEAYATGAAAGGRGRRVPLDERAALMAGPAGATWSKANADLIRYNIALGEYDALGRRAGITTAELQTNVTRLGIAEAAASNELRRHGALTTEYLTALARGESTVSEFGYQLGATIGKFAGWATAAAATYAAFGAVVEFGKGAVDASTGVQRLTRTIDNLDPSKANAALQNLSEITNVPIKEAADAVFAYSRTFHNLADATEAAKNGLSILKLDNVSLADTVKLSTSIFQQFGLTAQEQGTVWNELAAGQREYNARISETVPLLRAATGAVKNTGGDLQQLLQIAILATRIYPGFSGQIGTAVARGVAVQIPKNLVQLQQEFGIGLGAEANNSTAILQHAIRESATLSGPRRQELAGLLFEKRYGARFGGLFSPEAAATLATITGAGPKAITPAATKGALQQELDRELGTLRERMHSFVNEMQRFGAAFGASGILDGFALMLQLMVGVGSALRGVVNAFDSLPGPVKQVTEGLLAVRLAMLFLTRTRFGASIPLAPRLVPRFGALGDQSLEEQQTRASAARGTRQAINQVESELSQATARGTAIGVQRLGLARQAEALQAQIGNAEKASAKQLEQRNALTAKIIALGREEAALERERNVQQETLIGLKRQQVGLTSTRAGRGRYSTEEVMALGTSVNAAGEAVGEVAVLKQRLSVQEGRLASLIRLDAAGNRKLAAELVKEKAALEADIAATTAAVGTAEAAEVETATMTGRLRGFAGRLGTLAAAFDPLLAAFILLPVGWGLVKDAIDKTSAAAKAAEDAMKGPVTSGVTLSQRISDLRKAAARQAARTPASPQGEDTGLLGTFTTAEKFYGEKFGLFTRPEALAGTEEHLNRLEVIQRFFNAAAASFTKDERALAKTQEGRRKLYEVSQRLKQQFGNVLHSSGLPESEQGKIYQAFINTLQHDYAQTIRHAPQLKNDPFAALEQDNLKQIKEQLQREDDLSKIYGVHDNYLRKAAEAYAFAVSKFAKPGASAADLQTVQSAQQNFISTITKQVQDFLHAAQGATTAGGQAADIRQALAVVARARQTEARVLREILIHDKGNAQAIARDRQAAAQIYAMLNDQLKSAIDADLALIQAQTQLRTAQITGISPEAAIARAESELTGLEQQLAKAKADGASWLVVTGLQAQIDQKNQEIVQQKIQNADAIAQAREALAVSAISGIGPGADLARARQALANAEANLARDRAEGKGLAQILADETAVNDARRALNQQILTNNQQLHQQLAAYIQSQASLAASQTTDPVKQAQITLAADIRALSTIHRSDFTSTQEYLTALNNQQAKINQDRTAVNQARVNQELENLRFEHDLNRIGDQAYINGLRAILKNKKLSLQERHQILEEIYHLQHDSSKGLELGVGSIKIPSIYQIRRAIGAGRQGEIPGSQNTVINHSSTVQVTVTDPGSAEAVGRVIDAHLGTSVRSAMRASGVI